MNRPPSTVVAIVACHNRRHYTVRCLRSLFSIRVRGVDLRAVVADDGSSDGTADAVRELALPTTIITGSGTWFWTPAMAEAEAVAERDDPDWILWLNDDVEVWPDGIARLVAGMRSHPDSILVGGLWSERKGKTSYAGLAWHDPNDITRVRLIEPVSTFLPVEGFHGNFVAVPRSARQRIGPIDRKWPHHYGDLDYSRRATAAGVEMLLLPGYVGVCEPEWAPEADPRRTRVQRVMSAFSRRGWPLRAQLRFGRMHGTRGWYRHTFAPYLRAWQGRAPKASPTSK